MEQPRATNRYKARQPERDKELVKGMLELPRKHPRYGYRRITVLLNKEGFGVNRKRVQRLWRKEGLKVPMKQRKRRRLGHGGNSCFLRRSEHRNEAIRVFRSGEAGRVLINMGNALS